MKKEEIQFVIHGQHEKGQMSFIHNQSTPTPIKLVL